MRRNGPSVTLRPPRPLEALPIKGGPRLGASSGFCRETQVRTSSNSRTEDIGAPTPDSDLLSSLDYGHLGPPANMKLLQLVLLCLSYATFLSVCAATLDSASAIKKKWISKVLHRVRRDVTTPAKSSGPWADDASAGPAFIRPEDVKDTPSTGSSSQPRLRVKRYRQSLNHYPHQQSLRVGCRFGTCTVQNLAHQIYQYTDKDKDGSAPARKISSMGYGRRRRRSVPARPSEAWTQFIRSLRGQRPAQAASTGERKRLDALLPWPAFLRR
ncbi:pro-adrenomedullin [Ambystoma mexicanum]|uniref:pro-adrenomedullin n=1 Tax=Ambystoma mexicanum TaxID=8296 RepID=UPI0037E97E43